MAYCTTDNCLLEDTSPKRTPLFNWDFHKSSQNFNVCLRDWNSLIIICRSIIRSMDITSWPKRENSHKSLPLYSKHSSDHSLWTQYKFLFCGFNSIIFKWSFQKKMDGSCPERPEYSTIVTFRCACYNARQVWRAPTPGISENFDCASLSAYDTNYDYWSYISDFSPKTN